MLGSKEKTWLIPAEELGLPKRPHLFKVGRYGTGENWAEKVCCEMLKLLEIPCAEYNLAVRSGTPGVISERFLPGDALFVPANMILSRADRNYDGSLRFRQVKYALLPAVELVKRPKLEPPLGVAAVHRGLTAQDIFIGYLLFDALVGNTDRHHENWGVVAIPEGNKQFAFYLAPSFDHASSLGRDLTDSTRRERLSTNDTRFKVEAYASRGRSAFYGQDQSGRALTGKEVVESLRKEYPETTKLWSKKLVDVDHSSFELIFDQVPREIASEDTIRFALRMLAYNQQMIREVALAN
jgi:hypothetical protein